jgi:hypothetical protein|tara:strand:+ start:1373 stop:1501 length:129 start_codon:yes stop_codon:yes gene_type:complete
MPSILSTSYVFRSAQGTLLRIRAGNDRFYNADTYLPMFLGEK